MPGNSTGKWFGRTSLELDLKMQENPDFLPWEFVEKANEWGFYTMWIPKMFGGQGYNQPSMAYFAEEIASECLAMANLIGVHYLGVASLSSTFNTRIINKICRDVAAGEKNRSPLPDLFSDYRTWSRYGC